MVAPASPVVPPGVNFGVQLIMMTKMWWGFNMYGKCRSSGGGFGFVPGALRHLSWSVIGSLVGINSVNLYTQVCVPVSRRSIYRE